MKRPAEEAPADGGAGGGASSSTSTGAKAPRTEGAEEKGAVVTDSEGFWRCQLSAIYQRRNPHKLDGVPALLEKYKGKEAVLYAKVCKTYDLDPSKFYSDPAAWEQYEKDVQDDEPAGGEEKTDGAEGEKSEGASSGGAVAVPSLFGVGSLFDKPAAGGSSDGVSVPSMFGLGTIFDRPAVGSGSGGIGASGGLNLFGSGNPLASAANTAPGDDDDSDEDSEPGGAKPADAKPADSPGECKTQ